MIYPDNVKIEISIAGESIYLTVPAGMQRSVRATERSVNSLFNTWRRDFPEKTDKELLAMMAYQYASYYDELRARQEEARRLAEETSAGLDVLLSEKSGDVLSELPGSPSQQ